MENTKIMNPCSLVHNNKNIDFKCATEDIAKVIAGIRYYEIGKHYVFPLESGRFTVKTCTNVFYEKYSTSKTEKEKNNTTDATETMIQRLIFDDDTEYIEKFGPVKNIGSPICIDDYPSAEGITESSTFFVVFATKGGFKNQGQIKFCTVHSSHKNLFDHVCNEQKIPANKNNFIYFVAREMKFLSRSDMMPIPKNAKSLV